MSEGLERFVESQDRIWPQPLEQLKRGRKASHWMWFVFPQLKGLGRSATAQYYGIEDLDEARRYLAHPVLGPRLGAACEAMLAHAGTPPEVILGPIDALKLRSSATLFSIAGGGEPFEQILKAFYRDEPCARTLALLGATDANPPRKNGKKNEQ